MPIDAPTMSPNTRPLSPRSITPRERADQVLSVPSPLPRRVRVGLGKQGSRRLRASCDHFLIYIPATAASTYTGVRDPRSILITGASSGIGAALAWAYAAPRTHLALCGRDAARLTAV